MRSKKEGRFFFWQSLNIIQKWSYERYGDMQNEHCKKYIEKLIKKNKNTKIKKETKKKNKIPSPK